MPDPLVSVVLPVYNGAEFLEDAVISILEQTYRNFELIAINDGSKDNSLEILKSFLDPRVIVIDQENIGLPATLNKGIVHAKGKYIARQDQDDISFPERFERQVRLLEDDPTLGMVGCWADILGIDGKKKGIHHHPSEPYQIAFSLLGNNPFVHSSVMFRGSVFEEVGPYCTDTKRQPPEDFELYSRIARRWKMANIPEVLHVYREVQGSMSRVMSGQINEKIVAIAKENISFYGQGSALENISLSAEFLNGTNSVFYLDKLKRIRKTLRACARKIAETVRQRLRLEGQIDCLIIGGYLRRLAKKLLGKK